MLINGKEYRSVWLEGETLFMINQNLLPFDFGIKELHSYSEVVDSIRDMTVRGAPAIGAAGAFALALAAKAAPDNGFRAYLRAARDTLIASRPTAVDLHNGVQSVYEQILKFIPNYDHARQVGLLAAQEFANTSAEDCRLLGIVGSSIIPDGARILTHCNAGALATVDWGTALAAIRAA
ncbi:MAG TPA: S-methyl-5-thioribose-1-phosphate isomerase, partial [Candidatus Cloacimonadota bacterium]|nr:S-methyl-5-thioribose-1-phosphate isomerase [Candidatus Cloacimonadota bacterium]